MEQHRLIHEITRIAEPVVRSLGLALWGIELIPSGRTVLRIYVDTLSGVQDAPRERPDTEASLPAVGGRGPGIDQCAKISRHIGLALEAEDLIPSAYVLEVSSPGLERPFFTLAQLAAYLGDDLTLKLGSADPALPDRKCLHCSLQAVGEQTFTVRAYDAPADTLLTIRWDNVRKAVLAPELPFAHAAKNGKKKSAPKADARVKTAPRPQERGIPDSSLRKKCGSPSAPLHGACNADAGMPPLPQPHAASRADKRGVRAKRTSAYSRLPASPREDET